MRMGQLRGGTLEPQEMVHERSRRHETDPRVFGLGSAMFPSRALREGISVEGSSGSGKSIYILQILRTLLLYAAHLGDRLFIWDFKGTARQHLETLELRCRVDYLNPLDARGVGIDVAREVTGTLEANGFAAQVIEPIKGRVGGEDGSVFLLSAQNLFAEAIKAFQQEARDDWRLIDVLEACQDERTLRQVLGMTRRGRAKVRDYLGAVRQAKGIMMTLTSSCEALEPVAAAMTHSRNITLTDWATQPGRVLVLHNVYKYRTNLYPLFRWAFRRAFELLVSSPPQSSQTTFVVDEARQAPFVEDLLDLATEGREFNIGFIAGWQDEQGMRRVIGPDGVGELRSCCSTQVFLQNNNPASAKQASERFGDQLLLLGEVSTGRQTNTSTNAPNLPRDVRQDVVGSWIAGVDADYRLRNKVRPQYILESNGGATYDPSAPAVNLPGRPTELWDRYGITPAGCPISEQHSVGESANVTVRQVERSMVSPAEVMHQPKAAMVDGELESHAYIASTINGCWCESTWGMQVVTIPRDPSIVPFEKRPDDQLIFQGWTIEDYDRLHLPPPEESDAAGMDTEPDEDWED
jgi:hypothetical protein